MNETTYIYLLGKARGPYEKWEIKLFASKYRDFFVFSDSGDWVAYKKWDGAMATSLNDIEKAFVYVEPSRSNQLLVGFKRFIKRNIFRDHH